MNFLFFQLKRLLMLPANLVSNQDGWIRSLWDGSGQSRALMLGLPSILFATIGIALLCWAKFGMADSLENRYKAEAEQSSKEKLRLVNELRREIRMLQVSKPADAGEQVSLDDLIPKDDSRRVELEEWQSREEVYLEKLIELNPDEAEYLFKLAIVSFGKGDNNRGLALMNLTAPLDEPGYVQGHLWLANYYSTLRAKSRPEALRNVALAVSHTDQCLKREKDNLAAKKMKAQLLFAQQDFTGAYEIFNELFDSETEYFKALIKINKRLGENSKNDGVLNKAIIKFRQKIKSGNLSEAEHVGIWNNLVACYLESRNYRDGEQDLLEEIERQSVSPEDSGKRVWAERLLATIYLSWTSALDRMEPGEPAQRLELLKKAHQYDSTNSIVLRELTRLGASKDVAIAQGAKQIYDPTNQSDAPAVVLNEIGSQLLSKSNYDEALRYFELARKKSSRNPEILNNLAYTYTVIDVPNPKRALKLVDEAIRYLRKDATSKTYLSFFHDTRGQALMQLDRMTEAAAEFEFALQDRPQDRGILKAIIRCYEASGLDPGAYTERLRKLDLDEENDTDE